MKHYSIPFIVVGKRLTISYEIRLRGSLEDAGFSRDYLVFEYDSDWADLDRIYLTVDGIDLPLLCLHASSRISEALSSLCESGYVLNRHENRLRSFSDTANWWYQTGYGERQEIVSRFIQLMMSIGRAS